MRLNIALILSDPESPPERKTWGALSTALDWVEQHPSPDARVPGPELLRRFLGAAFQRDLPTPDAAAGNAGMLDMMH